MPAVTLPTWGESAAILAASAAFITSFRNGGSIAKVKKIAIATHDLSNSAYAAQLTQKVAILEAAALVSHELADLRGSDSGRTAARALDVQVTAAKEELRLHQIKQAKVDARESADT